MKMEGRNIMRSFWTVPALICLLGSSVTLWGLTTAAGEEQTPPAPAPAAATPAPAPIPPVAGTGPSAAPARGADIPREMPSFGRQGDRSAPRISISFDRADIGSVLKYLSSVIRIPVVTDPDIKGNVTIVSMRDITLPEAYEVINAALRVRGYTMVGGLGSRVIRVVPLKKAIADNLDVRSGKDPQKILPGDNMITQVMPLDYISAVKLKEELKPLVADDQASLVAISATNTLIVTDTSANVRRIAEIIRELDRDNSDILSVEIYVCRYASAVSLADTVSKLFQVSQTTSAAQTGNQNRQIRPGGQPQPQPQVMSDDGLISLMGELRVVADERTNSLIISASKERVKLVLDTVKKLDVDTEPEVKSRVFALQFGDAKTVSDQLNLLFDQPQGTTAAQQRSRNTFFNRGMTTAVAAGNAVTSYAGLKRNVVVADVRTNSVIVTATEQNMKAFESMIKDLDAPKVLSEITRHFPLKYATAAELAVTLNQLFKGQVSGLSGSSRNAFLSGYGANAQSTDGPLAQLKNITVVSEPKTNALLVTGPPNSFTVIESLIAQLDKRTAQVFVEVAIVDVTLDGGNKFGVEWDWTSSDTSSSATHTGGNDFNLADQLTGFKYSIVSNSIKALLTTLQTRSDVKVLSTPTITTADNVEAKISIGQREPYISSETETSGGNIRRTVAFENVAISLTVTPHVNDATDVIAMDVLQTINEVIGREPIMGAPIIADRQAKTRVTVRDGQTIVIGGIIKNNIERLDKGVPILSRIPVIGGLFKSSELGNRQSELMVFMTPHILKDDAAVTAVTDKTRSMLKVAPQESIYPEAKK